MNKSRNNIDTDSDSSTASDKGLSRRKFLKMLGLGAGATALTSTVSADWSRWLPKNKDVSDINADKLDGQHANALGTNPGKFLSAESFTESDVSVSTTDTVISNESISISNNTQIDSVSSNHDETHSGADNDNFGVIINPNQTITQLEVSVGPNAEEFAYRTALLLSRDGSTQLASDGISNDGLGSATLNATLEAGTDYRLVASSAGPEFTGTLADQVLDINSSAFDITNSVYESFIKTSYDGLYVWNSITAYFPSSSGSATIEYTDPKFVHEWDQALFDKLANDGSIDVYLEESTDGGSTWTEIAGPISRGHDISNVAASSQLRYRVELSRPKPQDTSPELQSAHLRYLV